MIFPLHRHVTSEPLGGNKDYLNAIRILDRDLKVQQSLSILDNCTAHWRLPRFPKYSKSEIVIKCCREFA